ncbi:protein kinase [Clostridium sp. Mt-5]|uniref:Protein kinase n=1 Tax=Clostridium moutaii TaxID=3240932 RepID=A0ABV4BPJ0_9CLOT
MRNECIHRRRIPMDLKHCKYLGEGHSGQVYLMPDGRVLKIFNNSQSCRDEFYILKAVEKSGYFPKAYELGRHYIIREYVGGMNVGDYLKKYGLKREFVIRLADLIDNMKMMGFKKLEVRFPHLFVQEDGSLMVIDPRKSYEENIPYPKSFLRALKKMELLEQFMEILDKERPDMDWGEYIKTKK